MKVRCEQRRDPKINYETNWSIQSIRYLSTNREIKNTEYRVDGSGIRQKYEQIEKNIEGLRGIYSRRPINITRFDGGGNVYRFWNFGWKEKRKP